MLAKDIEYIVVHCSATKPGAKVDIADITEWHKARWGSPAPGYHLVITEAGQVQLGQSLDRIGAHVKGHNLHSWGVCLIGGLDSAGQPKDTFTSRQKLVAAAVIKVLKHLAPQAQVLGHRDLSPDVDGDGVISSWEWLKACPCFDVKQWWGEQ